MSETEVQLRMLVSDGAVSITPDKTEGVYLVEFVRWNPVGNKCYHAAGRGSSLTEAVEALYDKVERER